MPDLQRTDRVNDHTSFSTNNLQEVMGTLCERECAREKDSDAKAKNYKKQNPNFTPNPNLCWVTPDETTQNRNLLRL